MKKTLVIATLLLLCVVFVVACSGNAPAPAPAPQPSTPAPAAPAQPAAPEGQKVTLKIGHVEAEDRSTHIALVNFKDRVEAESNGNITVEIYPNASYGDDAEMVAAVAMGALQMTLPSTGNMSPYDEKWGIFDVPFLFTSVESAFNAVDGEIGDYLNSLLEGTGTVSLGYTYNGVRNMSNTVRPINEPADCKGIVFRIMDSAVFRVMFQCLGANPTPIAFSEVYTALQTGVAQGQENAASLTYAMKFHEVQKYYSLTEHVFSFLPIVTNEEWYNSLDDANKAVLDKNIPIMITEQREMEVADNDKYIQLIADSGCAVNSITPENHQKFVDAVQPLYEEYIGKWGQEIFDLAERYNQSAQ